MPHAQAFAKPNDLIAAAAPAVSQLLSDKRTVYIDAEWSHGSAGSFPVFDPSTATELGEAASAGEADVVRAVDAATSAGKHWHAVGAFERQRYLEALAAAFEAHLEELALLDSIDSGNPIGAMRNDVREGVKQLRFLAAAGLSHGSRNQLLGSGEVHYLLSEPYGVVGRILPFNHPAMFSISKIAAPLICGNTVVLKPAEQTPLSSILVAHLVGQVLPPGVVNVLTGGADTGRAIVSHPLVKRIAFTGSVETGRSIQKTAAECGVKHVSLELGGKNPMIVLPDADIDEAVAGAIAGMNLLVCQGQSCGSNSRILVHESVVSEFCSKLLDRLADIRVGISYREDTEMGPLVSAAQRDRVLEYIAGAQAAGTQVAFGGGRPSGADDSGYFVAPTLLLNPSPKSTVAQEEIFGPVMSLMPWAEASEAIEVANSVEYGLTASVWTGKLAEAHRFAAALDAGYVWINEHGKHYLGAPFGGKKSSGVGREESLEEIESYSETKSIHYRYGEVTSLT